MEEVVQCNQPAIILLASHPKEWCHILGLSISLCCWQIWHAPVAVARSATVSGRCNLCVCHHSHVFMCLLLGNDRDGWGKRRTAHRRGHFMVLIIEFFLCWSKLLMSMGHKYFHILCSFGEIYPHTLAQMFFSPIFQSRSFWVPYHPANPLAVQSHFWPFFLLNKVCMTVCCLKYGNDPLLLRLLGLSQKGVVMLYPCIAGWCPSSVQNHRETRPQLLSSVSWSHTGHTPRKL